MQWGLNVMGAQRERHASWLWRAGQGHDGLPAAGPHRYGVLAPKRCGRVLAGRGGDVGRFALQRRRCAATGAIFLPAEAPEALCLRLCRGEDNTALWIS